jgi:hypothetical protein
MDALQRFCVSFAKVKKRTLNLHTPVHGRLGIYAGDDESVAVTKVVDGEIRKQKGRHKVHLPPRPYHFNCKEIFDDINARFDQNENHGKKTQAVEIEKFFWPDRLPGIGPYNAKTILIALRHFEIRGRKFIDHTDFSEYMGYRKALQNHAKNFNITEDQLVKQLQLEHEDLELWQIYVLACWTKL